jgi:transposase
MQDVEFYQQILGLRDPWRVNRVELDTGKLQVDVYLEHAAGCRFACPECGRELAVYDHVPDRRWRHLDTCQFETIMHARIPRVACPEHGVKQAHVPWAEPGSRFTALFERFAIEVLQNCQTVKGACAILNLTWDRGWSILERAVKRGQKRKQPTVSARIGIDEKAFRKGHNYMTVVCDIDRSTVEHVSEGRTKASVQEFFDSRTKKQLAGIEAVAMDMHEPYIQATKEALPLAEEKIVHDRFHIMQHATEAVDKVRRREHRDLMRAGDDSLKGSKYVWIKSQENLTDNQRSVLESMHLNLKTSRAWAMKEMLRDLWNHDDVPSAKTFFEGWYSWAIRSRLEPMKKVARMIKKRLGNVVSYCRHFITNAVAEGLNSKIMAIKRRAGGFRNPDNFKTAIYFYCGGLSLYPQ